MVKYIAHRVFELKYYRLLKIVNESSLILVIPHGRGCKTNFKDVKAATTLKLTENTWYLFLISIKINCQNHDYNLRPHC